MNYTLHIWHNDLSYNTYTAYGFEELDQFTQPDTYPACLVVDVPHKPGFPGVPHVPGRCCATNLDIVTRWYVTRNEVILRG